MTSKPSVTINKNDVIDGDVQQEINITLAGPGGAGKTSFLSRFIENSFDDSYNPTITNYVPTVYKCNVLGRDIHLRFVDTAGQEEFEALMSEWIDQGDAFIFLYDVTQSSDQLDTFKKWLSEMEKRMKDQVGAPGYPVVPVIFVGNKIDLVEEGTEQKTVITHALDFIQKNVTFATNPSTSKAATPNPSSIHFEASAKTGKHVIDAVDHIVLQVVNGRVKRRLKSTSTNDVDQNKKSGCCSLM